MKSSWQKLERKKPSWNRELASAAREVLIVGMGGSPTERKRIGTQLVNLHYLDCQEQTDIERIIQDKDHIFLQSAGIPHLLRNQLYCLCLRAGKQPLEVAGEEELELKLKRALGGGEMTKKWECLLAGRLALSEEIPQKGQTEIFINNNDALQFSIKVLSYIPEDCPLEELYSCWGNKVEQFGFRDEVREFEVIRRENLAEFLEDKIILLSPL